MARSPKETALRGWVVNASAFARAFLGWTLLGGSAIHPPALGDEGTCTIQPFTRGRATIQAITDGTATIQPITKGKVTINVS